MRPARRRRDSPSASLCWERRRSAYDNVRLPGAPTWEVGGFCWGAYDRRSRGSLEPLGWERGRGGNSEGSSGGGVGDGPLCARGEVLTPGRAWGGV